MSAFLGKIHYLLYDKILLQEQLYKELIRISQENNINIIDTVKEAEAKFGQPVTGKLEEIIDHGNIHGYLQQLIQGVESRQGYVTLKALEKGLDLNLLLKQYYDMGQQVSQEVQGTQAPYQIYMGIYTNLLDGMPCDRVNVVTDNSEDCITWKTTTCLHQGYWDNQVEVYYALTDAFVEGYVSGASESFMYERSGFNKQVRMKESV